ncbi:CDC15 [Candida oxycetoniae]|uniref:non-specific serine/threonine protein kinase n=1 Tax=Candida oxycetoniae TaxID=497107 RepID=A0AAI9WZW8_9ASCO|nr:CDC15 [Candida oxycetoniae]KAI3406851.2 CDC15 [Candida oxycetoniae]
MSTQIHHFSQLNDVGEFIVPVSSEKPGSKSVNSSTNSNKKTALLLKYQENTEKDGDLEDLELNNELSFSKFQSLKDVEASSSPRERERERESVAPGTNAVVATTTDSALLSSVASIERTIYKGSPFRKINEKTFGSKISHHQLAIGSDYLPKLQQQQINFGNNNNNNNNNSILPQQEQGKLSSTPKHRRTTSTHISLTPAQNYKESHPHLNLNLNLNLNPHLHSHPHSHPHPHSHSHSHHDTLKNYQLGALIGNGAFANVYKATNLLTGEIVAIKQTRLEPGQDVTSVMGEIDLLKILKHPNIVKYHGFTKDSTTLNVILEYCGGGSLRQVYKRSKKGLSESQIKVYVRGILTGLDYLHGQGVVHRDVKAGNVLLTDEGEVKLADFGVAAKVNAKYNTVVGTPNWMAPETILGGEGLCTASDIWSLGATIIELFAGNPPYHDLNPMAALHAIGTDDHPPLPRGISPAMRDFLLECFQKQPKLRISANRLLKHQWLHYDERSLQKMTSLKSVVVVGGADEESKSVKFSFEHSTGKDFFGTNTGAEKDGNDVYNLSNKIDISRRTKLSKNDLLNMFHESDEIESGFSWSNLESGRGGDGSGGRGMKLSAQALEESVEDDPFLGIDVHDFDTNELEIQVKMEYLVVKVSRKLDRIGSITDQDVATLIKTTGRMLHLIKKYSFSHDTFVRDHGVLTLMELLESSQDFPKQQQLWYHAISTLNYIFENNVGQLENFCFLGGIPVIAHFRSSSYDVRVRLQVARFINCLNASDKALSMFVSCGGLRLVSKFVEEDFDTAPQFPLTAIDSVHTVLRKDVSRSKSDLCRILSKHGVLFWFAVLLNRLLKKNATFNKGGEGGGGGGGERRGGENISQERIQSAVSKIIDVVGFFSQSETKVRISVASVDIFKLWIKLYDSLQFTQQLVILKFIRSMSCIPDVLRHLYKAEILEFLAGVLERYVPPKLHYKEVMNIIAPIIYNCLSLNHAREAEFLELGTLPNLKILSQIDLPFRQFILPIMCEIAYCDSGVRAKMKRFDILGLYYNLVLDPYWQSNALEALFHWNKTNPGYVKIDSPASADCLAAGFLLAKVANLESALSVYLQLLGTGKRLLKTMSSALVVKNLLTKLIARGESPVAQLSLLKILKQLVTYIHNPPQGSGGGSGSGTEQNPEERLSILTSVDETLKKLTSRQSSVLIDEVAGDIADIIRQATVEIHCNNNSVPDKYLI